MSQAETLQGLDTASQKHEQELVIELSSDRILHFLGVSLPILLAVVTKITEITGNNLSCFTINEQSASASYVKHATTYCWEESQTLHTVNISFYGQNVSSCEKAFGENNLSHSYNPSDYLDCSTRVKRFIQWMPYAMLLEAFLFALPMAWWHFKVGARMMGHLKFMQKLLEDIYESVKQIPAGIYRCEPYDQDGDLLNCWGKVKIEQSEATSKQSITASSTRPGPSIQDQPSAGVTYKKDGSKVSILSSENDSSSNDVQHSNNDMNASVSRVSSSSQPTITPKADSKIVTAQIESVPTLQAKNGQRDGEKSKDDHIKNCPKDDSKTEKTESSVSAKETTTAMNLSTSQESLTQRNAEDKEKSVSSQTKTAKIGKTRKPSNSSSEENGNFDHDENKPLLTQENTSSDSIKKAIVSEKPSITQKDENMGKSSTQNSSGSQNRTDVSNVVGTSNEEGENVFDAKKRSIKTVIEHITKPDFHRCEDSKKKDDDLSSSSFEEKLFNGMEDRHIFSMLCFENFASLQHQPYLKSVHQLLTVPEYEEDKLRILPLKDGVMRQFCHENNFRSRSIIKIYLLKCIMSITIALSIFISLCFSFVYVILPTLQKTTFLCELPYHAECFSCTLSGLINVHAAFFANCIVVTIYFVLSCCQLYYIRSGSKLKMSQFFEDIRTLSSVALVAAHKVPQDK
uniref:uncharacterized protein LOC120326525 n=1 Tax=Styela clava TaxID=7725 RepID=UPI00193986E9|nr:uncharacterized protein LOC120326525 [Styela clava]